MHAAGEPLASRTMTDLDAERLRRLLDAGQEVVARLELDAVLRHLLSTACEITGARYAAIGVLDEDRTGLSDFVAHGLTQEQFDAIGELPRGRGVLGVLIDEPVALRLDDVTKHPRSFGFPPDHPPMKTFLGVPVLIRGEAWGNLYLTEKAGGVPFEETDEASVQTLAGWAAIAIENARLYEGVERRRDELERAVRGLEATTAIARALGGETRLDRVLELIARRVRALVHARAIEIAMRGGDSVIAGEPGGEDPVMAVPLVFRGRPLGELRAFADTLSADDEQLLNAFAASAATAVATAQSVERQRLRRAMEAAEEERKRWARELHDETLQGLGALRMGISAAAREPDAVRMREQLAELGERVAGEIQNLRAIITDLRPAALDQLGLRPALESLVERVAATEGLDARLDVDLPRPLGSAVETTVYRLVQEALTNVAKHAGASRVSVRVATGDGDRVDVLVADDGRGFDASAPSDGFGLRGMQERVQLAGGSLDVRSGGSGTEVRAEIPALGGPAGQG